jgi:hypothetical protein
VDLAGDEGGCVFFANLLTRETRWLPPRTWMPGWISCPLRCPRNGIEFENPLQASRHLTDLLLPREIARKRVEGGEPYMHEHGEPQYAPDKDDSELTYPRGKRLADVVSALARAGPAALSPPAALKAATPSAAARRAMHAQLLVDAVAPAFELTKLAAPSPMGALDSAAPAGGAAATPRVCSPGGIAARAQPDAAACAAAQAKPRVRSPGGSAVGT